jgi:hypothetical protein
MTKEVPLPIPPPKPIEKPLDIQRPPKPEAEKKHIKRDGKR